MKLSLPINGRRMTKERRVKRKEGNKNYGTTIYTHFTRKRTSQIFLSYVTCFWKMRNEYNYYFLSIYWKIILYREKGSGRVDICFFSSVGGVRSRFRMGRRWFVVLPFFRKMKECSTASPLLVEVILKDIIQGNSGHNAANRQVIQENIQNKHFPDKLWRG